MGKRLARGARGIRPWVYKIREQDIGLEEHEEDHGMQFRSQYYDIFFFLLSRVRQWRRLLSCITTIATVE